MRRCTGIFLMLLTTLVGCNTSGLSVREVGFAYSNLVYGLYEGQPAEVDSSAIERPHRPLRLGVAQVGEVAPPSRFLETLRAREDLFRDVQVLPLPESEPATTPEQFATRMKAMRGLARDLGVDCVFLYGGNVDDAAYATPWVILDLTLVTGFFVPSNKLEGVGRASGALVDVGSGRVHFVVQAEADADDRSPSWFVREGSLRLRDRLRTELQDRIAEDLIDRVASESDPG